LHDPERLLGFTLFPFSDSGVVGDGLLLVGGYFGACQACPGARVVRELVLDFASDYTRTGSLMVMLLALGALDGRLRDGSLAFSTLRLVGVLGAVCRSVASDGLRRVGIVDAAFPLQIGVLTDEAALGLTMTLPLTTFPRAFESRIFLVGANGFIAEVSYCRSLLR
jgi:hypothetical protein